MHPTPRSVADLESLAKLSAQPRDMKKGVACPLCRETLSSVREYERHVGRHQEQLALFALPSQDVVDDEGDVEEERSDESVASQTEAAPEPAARERNKSEPVIPDRPPVEALAEVSDHKALASAIELRSDIAARIAIIRAMLAKGKAIETLTGLTAANTTGARKPVAHTTAAGRVTAIARNLAATQREMAYTLKGRVQWQRVASGLREMRENLGRLREELDGESITDLDTQEVLGELVISLALTTEAVRAKAAQASVENSNSTGGASTERTMEQKKKGMSQLFMKHRDITWICVSS